MFKIGDTTKTGALVIAVRDPKAGEQVVLCLRKEHTHEPYVTWIAKEGETFTGHYHMRFDDAVKDFLSRW